MSQLHPEVEHLFRRAGFGVSTADVAMLRDMSPADAVDYLVDYEGRPDDVDARIGRADHAQVTTRDLFAPDAVWHEPGNSPVSERRCQARRPSPGFTCTRRSASGRSRASVSMSIPPSAVSIHRYSPTERSSSTEV